MSTPELTVNNLQIKRDDHSLEHGIFIRPDPNGPIEHLVHVNISPLGHVTHIDPHEHPNMHPELDGVTPEIHAARTAKFLDLGGEKFLGHPQLPETKKAEVARVKAKYGLSTATV